MRSLVLAALVVPSLALAAPKPKLEPGSKHTPPVVLDEASFSLELFSQGSDGYKFRAHVEMSGWTSPTDRARIDWKQGGKVIVSTKCQVGREGDYANGTCSLDEKSIKAKGPIEAELIYSDDQTDKDYLVRTIKVNVHQFKGQWEVWQIAPDDVLASAWFYMGHDDDNNATYRRPNLYLWFTTGEVLNNSVLRCTADGKKIPDIGLSFQDNASTDIVADYAPKTGPRLTYHWKKMNLLADVLWGKRDTLKQDLKDKHPKDNVLSDNPGKWDCALRYEGKAIRQLLFTVDKDGMILQDEIQSGKNPIPVVSPRVVLVDVRLTKDSATVDKRIVPAALKKSMGFGLPWPDHPKVKAIHASYPPKSGMPDPK